MMLKNTSWHTCSIIIGIALLLGLSSCGAAQPNSTIGSRESPASSIVEEPLSITHPFAYSDVTWSTSLSKLETVIGKSSSSFSYVGNAKKRYFFESIEYNGIKGHCSYTYINESLCESAFTTDSPQALNDTSDYLIANLTETYGTPTTDKSIPSDSGTGIWFIWETDEINISYLYNFDSSTSKYKLALTYHLPDSKLPIIPISNRSGDFRIGFWNDDIDTINKYETAKFEGISEDEYGTTMMYSGTVTGKNAYIFYLFDGDGKLYKGAYQLTDTYNEGSMYISVFDSLKDSLTEKYGKPISDKKNKLTSLANYTDDGTALQLGYVVYGTEWKTDTSKISLGMLGVNYEINILIDYVNPAHKEVKNTSGLCTSSPPPSGPPRWGFILSVCKIFVLIPKQKAALCASQHKKRLHYVPYSGLRSIIPAGPLRSPGCARRSGHRRCPPESPAACPLP